MMDFSVCAVIPVYNHGETIGRTLMALRAFGLHCMVIDDGSDATTRETLEVLATGDDMSLYRLEQNQGKGAAVMAGLKYAYSRGYSHALQIDADGQHDCQDIPLLIKTAEASPGALICGQPQYDASAPSGRMLARSITHFWVSVETLLWHPPDSMCGFRVYPLQSCCALLDKVKLGKRMDFDIEILVRLIWQKVSVIPISTRVIYPENGRSHFNYIRDNILISWMHARLFFGMLYRLPLLLCRKLDRMENQEQHWSAMRERGTVLGIKILLWAYKLFGRLGYQLILFPVMCYYFIANHRARRASQDYLQRIYHSGKELPALFKRPSLLTSFRHFMAFGGAAIDRVASWAGDIKRSDIEFIDNPKIVALTESGSGAVIISAHLGNIELARALADETPAAKMNVLVFTDHAEKFNSVLKKVNTKVSERVIHVNRIRPDTAIMLKQKIEQGELIVILGDRTAVHSKGRVNRVEFLGEPALFSQGPFILAALLACPVYLMFCLKRNKRYHVYFEHFAERIVLNRKARDRDLQAVIQRFAQRLAYYCRLEPLQWFNFYDFWRDK